MVRALLLSWWRPDNSRALLVSEGIGPCVMTRVTRPLRNDPRNGLSEPEHPASYQAPGQEKSKPEPKSGSDGAGGERGRTRPLRFEGAAISQGCHQAASRITSSWPMTCFQLSGGLSFGGGSGGGLGALTAIIKRI